MTSKQKRISRLLVAVLSVLLIAEFIPFYGAENRAFAADEKKVEVDEPAITLGEEEPEPEADVEIDAGEILDEEGNAVEPDSVPAVFPEEKEKKPTKKKLATDDDYPDVDPNEASVIGIGTTDCEIDEGGKTLTYAFTPAEDGKYLYYSQGSMDTCSRISIYDSETDSYVEKWKNDDDGEDSNFSISFSAVAGQTYYMQVKFYSDSATGSFRVVIMKDQYSASLRVSLNKKTGMATVRGTVQGDSFDKLHMITKDNEYSYEEEIGSFSGTRKVNMKKYHVGYHSFYATLKNHPNVKVKYKKAVPTYIYTKPSNKLSYFTVGHNYFTYSYGGNSYKYDYNCGLMLEYKKGKGTWKKGYGPYKTYDTVKMKKVKSSKTYRVRTYYARKFKYNGKWYKFKGSSRGKYSKTVKFKTGGKKLRIKSVKIRHARQFSKTSSYTLWLYIGGVPYPRTITNTYWYTEFDISVKLKKKPGAKGIFIGSKMVKGNKKKYKTHMILSGQQKGKKLKFEFCSYQSSIYKGYSKSVFKKVKVRK